MLGAYPFIIAFRGVRVGGLTSIGNFSGCLRVAVQHRSDGGSMAGVSTRAVFLNRTLKLKYFLAPQVTLNISHYGSLDTIRRGLSLYPTSKPGKHCTNRIHRKLIVYLKVSSESHMMQTLECILSETQRVFYTEGNQGRSMVF